MGRMRGEHQVPESLQYREDFLSEAEEAALIQAAEGIEYRSFELRGQVARRTVRTFGYSYDFDARSVTQIDPLPEWLLDLRDRCAVLAEVDRGSFVHALVNRYPPGATIGWHRDAPPFGPTIAGVSLAADCEMRFQRTLKGIRYVHQQPLARRSAYVLGGLARSAWQHSIPAIDTLRYSITFRTLKRMPAGLGTVKEPRQIVVLVGMMGAGKTTTARALAARLDWPIIDSDVVIEKRTGRTGADLAAEVGVEELHRLEEDVLLESLAAGGPVVITAAASVVTSRRSRQALVEHATVVWLDAPVTELEERMSSGTHRRPLDREAVATLLAARRGYLAKIADLRVDARKSTEELVAAIQRTLQQ